MDSLDAMEDKSKFLAVYEILKSEIFSDPSIQGTEKVRQVVEKMLDYNVPNGKLHRGLSVVSTYKILQGGEVSEDEFFLACVLGWCIEWLQACCHVLDDIMDDSHTRRSQLCWFRLPEVGNLAIFDGMLLYCQKGRILNTYFHSKDFYPELLELFNEVEFQTGCGQMLDLITCHETVELRKCNLITYLRIVKYKTSYYSFYLPVACALLMAGENLDDHVPVKNILVKMGNYFQIQDDYLDCFGDPAVIGKIGTDIEDFKCSWLLVQALERANHEQLLRLHANYGKKDPSCVSEVKALYKELGLQNVFWDYENTTHKELIASIEEVGSPPLQCILESFVKQIYRRLK